MRIHDLGSLLLIICLLQTTQGTLFWPYQSHSFNDLDYIIQQLKKGVDMYKFDVSYADYTSCSTYSTWKPTDNPCVLISDETKICCLAHRGDASSSPIYRDYFNTTIDFAKMFKNPDLDFIWSKTKRHPSYNRTIFMVFNLQEFAVSDLYTTFFYDMLSTIQNRSLDVVIIDDAGAGYSYLTYCQSNKCDYREAYLASYNWNTQCGEASNWHCMNFNIEAKELAQDCQIGFPLWSLASPLIFYEFAQQGDIVNTVNTFLSPTCKKNPGQNTLNAIRLTSNIDREMLQAFLPQPSYVFYTNTTNHIIENFEGNNSMLIFYNQNTSSTHIQIRSLNQQNFFTILADFNYPDAGVIFKAAYENGYLLYQNQTGIFLFNATFSNNQLVLLPVYSIDINETIGIDLTVPSNGEPFVTTLELFPRGCAGLLITIFDINQNQEINNCIDAATHFDFQDVINGDIAITFQPKSTDVISGLILVTVNETYLNQMKPLIYGYTFNCSVELSLIYVKSPKSYLDIGNHPVIKFYKDKETIYVLEAHSDSICYCGTLFNNADTYKCDIAATLDTHKAQLQSVPHILNYNWGLLADIEERIFEGKYLSPCDKQIMHAKYGNGDNPDGIIYKNLTTGNLQAIMVNDHTPFVNLPTISKLFCGARSADGNVIPSLELNIFDVLNYDQLQLFK